MGLSPRATLVLASFNHEDFVDQALESVAAQTEPPRLIITDDASTDDSVARITSALERLGLDATTIFHATNAGLCPTFNEALAAVDTPYVAFLSADDWMEPERIEQQSARFEAGGPELALVHSDMFVHREGSEGADLYSQVWEPAAAANTTGRVYLELFRSNFIATPSVMLRTDAVREVGGFDEELPFEDYDLYLRLAQRYELDYDPAPLVHYRRHGANLTDDASPRRRVAWLRAVLRINDKHFGQHPEIDEIAAVRNFDAACQLYKAGAGSPRPLIRHFLRYARHHRAPKGVAFALLAALGVPGRWLPRSEDSGFWE